MPERPGTAEARRSLGPTVKPETFAKSVARSLPRHQLNTYGRRAFAIAGRSACNSLPDPVRISYGLCSHGKEMRIGRWHHKM